MFSKKQSLKWISLWAVDQDRKLDAVQLHLDRDAGAIICIRCNFTLKPSSEAVSKHLWQAHQTPSAIRGLYRYWVRINCTRGAPVESWIPMEDILTPASQASENLLGDAPEANEDDPCIISLVDGDIVRHSNTSVAGMVEKVSGKIGLDSSRRLCNAVKPCHLAAIVNMLGFWIRGSRICFPAERFSAGATIQAISTENLTDLVLDSSMTKAVVQHQSFKKSKMDSLIRIAVLDPEASTVDMTEIVDAFGVQDVTTWSEEEGQLVH